MTEQRTELEEFPYELVKRPIIKDDEQPDGNIFAEYIRCQHCHYIVHDTRIRGHFNQCIYSF